MIIPESVLQAVERELTNLTFGSINLEIVVNDSKPRFRIVKTLSIVPERPFINKSEKTSERLDR